MNLRHWILIGWMGCGAAAAWAQEMPKPGPEHDKFKEMVGEWEATVKFAGQESKGKSVIRLDFNGFFLVHEFEGDFGGMKFKGHGQLGYCPLRKKYISTWIDSMSPSMMVMEGQYAEDGKSFTEEGQGPGMDGKMHKFKNKSVMKDKDTMIFTMYQVDDGKEVETMTITYQRKK